jgi:hypothetical protein
MQTYKKKTNKKDVATSGKSRSHIHKEQSLIEATGPHMIL